MHVYLILIHVFYTYPEVQLMISVSKPLIVAGDSVTLTCSMTLPNGVTGSPEFQWEGPGETPDPAALSTSGQEVTSQLTLSAIRTSQAGQYTCTASLGDFSENATADVTVRSEFFFVYSYAI